MTSGDDLSRRVGADVVVVVDMQRAFFFGHRAVAASESVLASVEELLVRARAARAPVVLVQNDGAVGSPDETGGPGWELAVSRDEADVVIRKRADDAFEGTELESFLRARGVSTIALTGVYSEMCVAATARGAMARGFEVVLPHDGHAGDSVPAWEGVSDAIPASVVSRVAEWSLGDRIVLVPRCTDVWFTEGAPIT